MNAILKIGTLFCWAIGIGSEYVIQKWPGKTRVLNSVAALGFIFALSGEYLSYRYDTYRESRLEAKINA
jgi:hypothetical protein